MALLHRKGLRRLGMRFGVDTMLMIYIRVSRQDYASG